MDCLDGLKDGKLLSYKALGMKAGYAWTHLRSQLGGCKTLMPYYAKIQEGLSGCWLVVWGNKRTIAELKKRGLTNEQNDAG